jgi:N-acyl-D-amino-acid deacylase
LTAIQCARVACAVLMLSLALHAPVFAEDSRAKYDVVISGGTVFDGSGRAGVVSDVAIANSRIVRIGTIDPKSAKSVVNAKGKAVAPGFINMLSWANEALMVDGRGMSDIKQGVTLEVMGEGSSMGPLTPEMKTELTKMQADFKYNISWTTLGEYLDMMVKTGVSPNIASFVGAETVRVHELGQANRKPTPAELARMQELVRQAMREGAMGVSSSLIYAPGSFADTDELIALSKAAAPFGGRYASHLRSEADAVEGAVDELIHIAREAKIGAEIHHMKLGGKANWGKFDVIAEKVAKARAEGLDITANMYTYVAGATGLDASMPPWVQADGYDAWVARLKDPATRARVIKEMNAKGDGWENLFFAAGDAENIKFLAFKNPKLRSYTGKTLAEVAAQRGTTPADAAVDLVIEDGSRVEAAYFLMSEENVRRTVQLPYVSFGSDAEASAPEGVFLSGSVHPRAYGNFARLLGKHVREEKLISLPEAIYRLTALPARNLKLKERGRLKPGYFADIVVFDPATIADKATYAEPMQYAVGVSHVFVNGVQVLKDGEHTGAKPGQVVRGPGWTGWQARKKN